jgi:hypothetical protein
MRVYKLTDGYYSGTHFQLDNLVEVIKASLQDLKEEDAYCPEIEVVEMAKEEFDNLPEYQG